MSTTDTKTKKMPGTADMGMPWEDLGFEFRPTNSHVKLTWKDGEGWSEPELIKVSQRYALTNSLPAGGTAVHLIIIISVVVLSIYLLMDAVIVLLSSQQ
jgi:hypothetical protein